ncbi:hypothetical protein [uncultured Thioclava sp.]|uniref:hypothetical protein n=1 Tax=uncultured Thioclava sp. TaxID=473858 RepID=UPI0025E4853A|nr:hypothetical protein [uncultured Thioclava sp.]
MPQVIVGIAALGGAAIAAGGIGAALAATGTFIGFAANFGVSMLLSGVAQALAPKPKQQGISSRDVTVREPAHPREIVYGQTRKGGVIVALEVSGQKRVSTDGISEASDGTSMLHVVVVMAGHQIEAIDEIYFDGDLAVNADGSIADAFAGAVEVEKRLGADDQAAFAIMMDYLPGKWTEDHKLSGCAAIALHLTWDNDKFPNGLPNVTANIRGKNDILDPRTGLVGYTDNAALCVADYLASSIYGMGAEIGDARGINEDALIAGANACDEIVDTVDGATETRFTLDGIIDTSQSPQPIVEAKLS